MAGEEGAGAELLAAATGPWHASWPFGAAPYPRAAPFLFFSPGLFLGAGFRLLLSMATGRVLFCFFFLGGGFPDKSQPQRKGLGLGSLKRTKLKALFTGSVDRSLGIVAC